VSPDDGNCSKNENGYYANDTDADQSNTYVSPFQATQKSSRKHRIVDHTKPSMHFDKPFPSGVKFDLDL